ncbi:MAG: 50S ribosomal protein L15, partial [Nitrospira sp.]|nr:50S ribosomal protein L15 [Nitrospira sp.]
MNLNDIKSRQRTRKKPMVRKGRGPGTGKGKTCGKGTKGHSARAGSARKYYFEGGQMPLVRRLPKRGFNNKRFRSEVAVLNVRQLEVFEDGSTVGPQDFLDKGLINAVKDGVKVLGDGAIKVKLTVQAHRFSASAKAKILEAGG